MHRPQAGVSPRPARGRAWALVLACFLVLAGIVPSRGSDAAPVEVHRIVQHIRRASALPEGQYGFRQNSVLHWLLAKWYFHSEVVRGEDGFTIETFDAPAIVPKNISGALIEVSEQLDRFILTLDEVEVLEDGVTQYVISGDRRPEFTTGAEGGRIWVRDDTWLIHRIDIRYPWGRLEIRQDHQSVRGYNFPRRQQVRVTPLGASMTVDYTEFWFADEVSPSGLHYEDAGER